MTTINAAGHDITTLVTLARRAQREWAALPVRQRLQPVEAFRRLLVSRTDEICASVAHDVGKPPREALAGELLPVADTCRYLTRQANRILQPRRVPNGQRPLWMFGQTDVVHRRPRGVVGIIGTWNYPLFLNAGQILHALVAGNAVVWKPSEVTPDFADVLHRLFLEAGFPNNLFQRLPATREMGPALADADVDHVVFTGSANVGRKLAERLGARLISSTLELSGCDVQLVLEDADVTMSARAAWFGSTINRGQTCIAVRRTMVHRSIYPAFCEALRPLAEQASVCRLTIASQAEQMSRVIEEAVEAGAKRLVEAKTSSEEGVCIPTVLIDVTPQMSVCKEASFAPILTVMPFDDVEEALRMDAQCPYALGGSIFTKNLSLGQQLTAHLRAGAISINDVILPIANPATPFGGRGDSGWGVTQGAEGLLEMTTPQTVTTKGGTFRPHYETADAKKLEAQDELLRGMLQATHGTGMFHRLAGWWKVIRAAMKGV